MKLPTCTCGVAKKMAKMVEDDKVHQFLMGLDDESFSTIRRQILALEPLPSIDKIFNMVQQEEDHKKVMTERDHKHDTVAAFAVTQQHRDQPSKQYRAVA